MSQTITVKIKLLPTKEQAITLTEMSKTYISTINDLVSEMVKESKLFNKPSTAKKLKAELCNCTPGVVDIQYLYSVRRAKEILARGLALIAEKETEK